MNQFDFYTITAVSTRKSDLKGAKDIQKRPDGWAVYGTRRYRRWCYAATISYVDVAACDAADLHGIVNARVENAKTQFPNATVSAQYIARD